jgi:mycoredoxin
MSGPPTPDKLSFREGETMEPTIKVYGVRTCSDTIRARSFLDGVRVSYMWIDVDEDEEGLRLIKRVNNGNRTTPTIFFGDGSVLSEPSDAALAENLEI